ncbi:MAG TPA: dUTP diphosphatase [Verrucomicrobia bacterium]|nr:dUTP diphosphatase [Verrucomicrobiota bacterium]
MTLAFKRIHPQATLPAYAHASDAGMDIRSVAEVVLPARGRALVPTGLVMLLPPGYEAQVRPRSGLALKNGITVLNAPGTIDAGYRGEIGVILFNTTEVDYIVHIGDRIAQLVIAPVTQVEPVEANEIDETTRGAGGFGSTGKK